MTLILKNHVTDQEKIRIASNFILKSPPKEIKEVFNDLRILISDDFILKQVVSNVFSKYNKIQLTPVKIGYFKLDALITDYNDLGSGRFYEPRLQKSFKYDHLRNEATDFEPWEPNLTTEVYRKALEEAATKYFQDHYKQGTCCVFSHYEGGRITLTICIESHQFQPQDFWNGKWRSIWSIVFTSTADVADIRGTIKVQVHYFEDDGNVHLVTSKEVKESVPVTTEYQIANEVMKLVEKSEIDYQISLLENYEVMSNTTFKTLRRSLPLTRTKLNWQNILACKNVGNELEKLLLVF
ncbi:unnamed protein product [Larinioides sclopetarius]|uniref:F-actin-capping protein subunit alpha n=1 Tax=Larinioides sclopetarius TaxID=280406 RepID=A0AAV2BBP0_9ARAC